MSLSAEGIAMMFQDCEKRESQLSDWERGFIESLKECFYKQSLTRKQEEGFEVIWERVTS